MKRLAQSKDLIPVYTIYMHDSVIPFLGYDPMSQEQFEPIFSELCQSRNFFVYECGADVAGFLKVSRHPGRCRHVAYIGSLAVSPKYQGQGLAKKIMSELIVELATTDVKRIELIVESDNSKAISFYTSLGFQIEGTLKKFYKRSHQDYYVDDYMMGLLIGEGPPAPA